jgi:hypothetical protein
MPAFAKRRVSSPIGTTGDEGTNECACCLDTIKQIAEEDQHANLYTVRVCISSMLRASVRVIVLDEVVDEGVPHPRHGPFHRALVTQHTQSCLPHAHTPSHS